MMRSAVLTIIIILLLSAVALCGCAARSIPIHEGRSYIFAYDCLPEAVALALSHVQAVNPCYTEVVHVRTIHGIR